MKDAYEVLYQKEAELTRVRQEIESLKVAASILSEEDLSFFQPSVAPETDSKKAVESVAPEAPELASTGTGPLSSAPARTGIWDSFKRRR